MPQISLVCIIHIGVSWPWFIAGWKSSSPHRVTLQYCASKFPCSAAATLVRPEQHYRTDLECYIASLRFIKKWKEEDLDQCFWNGRGYITSWLSTGDTWANEAKMLKTGSEKGSRKDKTSCMPPAFSCFSKTPLHQSDQRKAWGLTLSVFKTISPKRHANIPMTSNGA